MDNDGLAKEARPDACRLQVETGKTKKSGNGKEPFKTI